MFARPNSGDAPRGDNQASVVHEGRRKELRYRLAHLLHEEKFDEALDEALAARRKDDILPVDFEFVINIVKAAARMGRVKIERERHPDELFPGLVSPPQPNPAPPQSPAQSTQPL